jgi:hypothetical protein
MAKRIDDMEGLYRRATRKVRAKLGLLDRVSGPGFAVNQFTQLDALRPGCET